LDRAKGLDMLWSSGAEVASHIGKDGWSLEVRIPLLKRSDEARKGCGVSGRKPTETFPWYFNVCRQRIRGEERQLSAFSPTHKTTFHDIMKFARLFVR